MRLTTKQPDHTHLVPADLIASSADGVGGPAIERLAAFEDLYEEIMKRQQAYTEQMEQLRAQGKQNSHQFKEIMGKKLMNAHIISLFMAYGIE